MTLQSDDNTSRARALASLHAVRASLETARASVEETRRVLIEEAVGKLTDKTQRELHDQVKRVLLDAALTKVLDDCEHILNHEDVRPSTERHSFSHLIQRNIFTVLMPLESVEAFLGDLRERYGIRPSIRLWLQIAISLRPLILERITTVLRPKKAANTR